MVVVSYLNEFEMIGKELLRFSNSKNFTDLFYDPSINFSLI